MLLLTDFSTASKMLNFSNPIQGTVRFRSVGSRETPSYPACRRHATSRKFDKNQSDVIFKHTFFLVYQIIFVSLHRELSKITQSIE